MQGRAGRCFLWDLLEEEAAVDRMTVQQSEWNVVPSRNWGSMVCSIALASGGFSWCCFVHFLARRYGPRSLRWYRGFFYI